MPANIIEAIQKSLNLPELHKIDPNDQEPKWIRQVNPA